MERKKFYDVFPTIKLYGDIADLFETVEVTKVAVNAKRDKMRIYIESSRLIEKSAIFTVRNQIARTLKTGKRIGIELVEKYHLSEQYSPENLLELYKDSIVLELAEKSPIVSTMFKKAPHRFENGNLVIDLETNIISDARMKILKETVENIFQNRFEMPVNVQIIKRRTMANRFTEINAKKLQNEVDVLLSKKQNEEAQETSEKKTESRKKAPQSKAGRLENSDIVYGKEFKFEKEVKLSDVFEGTGECVVKGQVMTIDERKTKTDKYIVSMDITDFTDSITVKIFLSDKEALDAFKSKVKKDCSVRIKGVAIYDTYDKQVEISHVQGMKLIKGFSEEKREDTAVEKRIELHCHTKMSDMDGVSDCKKIVRRAYEWGHKAIAITDHGVVQAFPDAWHEYCDIKKECKKAGKKMDFKVIYGVEAYLVDDLKDMITNPQGQSLSDTYVVFDLETTGFSAKSDRIIEIGAVKVVNGEITERFSTFVNPERPIPFKIEKLTGINDGMVINAPKIEEVLPKFMEFCAGAVMVAHNADFDMSFIRENCLRQDIPCEFTIVDTVAMARFLVIGLKNYRLNNVAKALNVVLEHHHRAVDDAECTALIFLKLCNMLHKKGITNLDDANREGKQSGNLISKLPAHHAIILCKNLVGRVNLYRLISISHTETFANKRPRILKSDYLKYKEGLMIGSACEAGELYQAILRGLPEQEVARLAEFYDYFEVQPIGNNAFMLKTGNPEIDERKKYLVDSVEELQEVNKKIIALGRKFHKMTVATCDVHFLDPEDEIYRRIIQFGQGYKDADEQAPLYLRTTDEMLKEFDYLDSDLAEEIVIKNPAKISEMIDDISPIHPDKCPPVLDNSEEELRNICFRKAHDMYGEKIPKIVTDRLEVELDSIIGNGYAVMYIMAQRLVWKSNEDGYLVGSRGSVGSSFAATMSGITECNPLQPHYYCEHCKSSVFQDEYSMADEGANLDAVKKLQEEIKQVREECGVGFDLPDAVCPCCGEKMKKDGLEIPFETFLGFGGTKEPDIDLNFSGEYQANAHAYTEVMFGKGHTFRAGTITGVADKTAYGYVKRYFEDHNITKRTAEIDRISRGCTGIRRSTGQHPGGIVIVPKDKEIYDFTPIQKPANDMSTDIITTHFEYHAIDANLLKLDILGHDDPTMIRRLESLTGVHVQEEVPFDDKKVMSLFLSPDALGITSEDIDGCPTGSLGLPELGTDFVIQMLVDTKPTKFADLVRLAGLSHGTDVWLGNAQKLIQDGQCTISSAICTRDDIMVYLMGKGIDPQISFQIMEHVRKGKGLQEYTDKQGNDINEEQIMIEHGVPDWYIWSCKKIKYMFPKAHAAAYVMMALRVAWFKVYKPLAYYAAYFGIRAKAFNYETMCQGKEKLEYFISEFKRKKEENTASPKDEAALGDMKVVQEMYARGFEFIPIDIYKAKAHDFQIIDGKLMPALDTIEGLGEKAADAFVEAVEKQNGEPFVSKNEMRDKTKVTKTVIEVMSDLHLLDGMPEDSQLSIFDF